MQCREFREVAESYLSDELLVETCIQVFRHLENCAECREDFAAKREMRRKMRSAVDGSEKFRIDPIFASRLGAELRDNALNQNTWKSMIFANKLLVPAMASLILAVVLGVVALNRFVTAPSENAAVSPDLISRGLTDISLKAVGDHQDCALEKQQRWEAMSKQDYAQKAVYTEKVAKPLQANFSEDIEMLHAHDCIFEGKRFTHVVLRKGTHIVSVLFDKDNVTPSSVPDPNSTIVTEMDNGLQVASFQKDHQAVFVVSDLSELDNLSIARTLSNSWRYVRI